MNLEKKMNIRKSDVIWNFVGTILSLSSNFIILPFILYFLDSDTIGLWNVFLSIGAIVILFDFGFNPTLARNIAYSWKGAKELYKTDGVVSNSDQPNFFLMKKIITTTKNIYLLISSIALLFLLTLGTLYVISISNTILTNHYVYAWIIYCLAVFMNLYYGYYTTFLRGVGAIRETNISVILSRVIQITVTVCLLFFGFDIISVAFGYLVYGFIFRYTSKKFFFHYKDIGKELKNITSNFDFQEVKKTFSIIWHNAWRDGLVYLSLFLSSQVSILIASTFLSLTETGIYSITVQLATAVAAISGSLYNVYQPSMQFHFIRRNLNESKELMAISMSVYIVLFILGSLATYFIGLPLIYIIKSSILFDTSVFTLVFIYIFLLKHHSYYASFISNTNKVPYVKSYLISSFFGVILSVVFVLFLKLGVTGLIIGQIISQAVYNNWKWPLTVYKQLDTNFVKMFKLGINNTIKTLKRITQSNR